MNKTSQEVGEREAIVTVLQHYINGAKSGKGDDMRPAFHDDATVFGYVGPDLFGGPIQELYTWNDENGPATETPAGDCEHRSDWYGRHGRG